MEAKGVNQNDAERARSEASRKRSSFDQHSQQIEYQDEEDKEVFESSSVENAE